MKEIAFIDLAVQQARLIDNVRIATDRVFAHGQYILGPEVKALEQELAKFSNIPHVIACSNGTDALKLALMALGLEKGDVVICPSFTFVATSEAPALLGIDTYFVDVDENTYVITPDIIEAALKDCWQRKIRIKAVIGVDLFGAPVDYEGIFKICKEYGVAYINDAAQSYGAVYKGQPAISYCDIATTSFFPAKPLGCYGDGGAVFCRDDDMASLIRSLAFHGAGQDKYENIRIGDNCRLDTLQAAILLEKLKIFPDEMNLRQNVANYYTSHLSPHCKTPTVIEGGVSSWAQYTIEVENRDIFQQKMREKNVPTAVYYPKPNHLQPPYQHMPRPNGGLAVTEKIKNHVVSLPMHPYLQKDVQDYIIETSIDSMK
jgi:dTDP-4-amino-4,6-dideoxygalactose transaminase